MQRPAVPAVPAGPDGPVRSVDPGQPDGAGLGPVRRMSWWSTVGLVYGLGAFVVASIVLTESSLPVAAAATAGTVAGTLAAARLFDRSVSGPGNHGSPGMDARVLSAVASAGAAVAVVAAQFSSGGPASWAVVAGLAVGGMASGVDGRRRGAVVAGGAVAAAVLAAGAARWADRPAEVQTLAVEAGFAAVVAAGLLGGLWYWEVVRRLDRTRRLERQLAVADERLRFADDLHDIQGHHLQVIARYSELAARLTESDPPAAVEHMQQAGEHAREALQQTRAVARGYRQTTLAAELANATRVLEAAGIDARLTPGTEHTAADLRQPARRLLGLVVREATTNILRHSRAGRARLDLIVDRERARLRIRNDGTPPAGNSDPSGAGLDRLARRLEQASGSLDWRTTSGTFTVTARIPVGPTSRATGPADPGAGG